MFPGHFESYWHFHHGGRRFGHWLGFAVVIDPDQQPAPAPQPSAPPAMQTSAVDLTMKCSTKYVSSTDDMKIYNSETKGDQENDSPNPVQTAQTEPTTPITIPSTVPVGNLLNISEPTLDPDNTKSTETDPKIENISKIMSSVKIYGVPPEWKAEELANGIDVEAMYEEEKRKNDEYNSASDSDNISVISGTVSVDTDDTEPSEEFVVIPMPACFNCEQALADNPVTQPISVEIPGTPPEPEDLTNVQESDNNNNMELKPYPELPMCLPVLITPNEAAQGNENNDGDAIFDLF